MAYSNIPGAVHGYEFMLKPGCSKPLTYLNSWDVLTRYRRWRPDDGSIYFYGILKGSDRYTVLLNYTHSHHGCGSDGNRNRPNVDSRTFFGRIKFLNIEPADMSEEPLLLKVMP